MATILVADDNSNIQKMVSLAFQEKGIRVVAVGNGEAACRKVPEVRPDLVLADVFMPVRNGYEVCEFVKQDPEFAETPVILLVGAFDPLDEKEAARVGANGVLKKPFVPPEPLISMVNSFLGRTEPVPEEQPAPEPEPEKHADYSNIQYTTTRPQSVWPPQEFAFGSDDDTSDTVTTSADPVATPSPTAHEQTETAQDDDLGPENEWAQRRKTMDYEIDAADSANLVEKLAAQDSESKDPATDNDEIRASNKHLPFGGANVPEILPANKWTNFFKRKQTAEESPIHQQSEPEMPVAPPPTEEARSFSYEASAPELELPDPKPKIAGALAPSQLLGAGEDVIAFRSPEKPAEENRAAAEISDTPVSIPDGPANDVKLVSWPLQDDLKPKENSRHWFDELSAPAASPEPPREKAEHEEKAPEILGAFSETSDGNTVAAESEVTPAGQKPLEPSAETASPDAEKLDSSAVDDVVAKVISKLEPHLHQALKDGVLRPLIEEVLNEKKKNK